MKETRSSALTSLQARFLAHASDLPGITYSALVNSQHPAVPIRKGWDLVQDLLERNLLTSPALIPGFLHCCPIWVTPAGTAALAAYLEARSARRRGAVWKVISALVSVAALAAPLLFAGI